MPSPVTSVRLTPSPKRSSPSEPPGTPDVLWLICLAPPVVSPESPPKSMVTAQTRPPPLMSPAADSGPVAYERLSSSPDPC